MADSSDSPPREKSLWVAGLSGLVGSLIATLAIRSAGLAAFDIPPDFPPLAGPGPTIFFTADSAVAAIVIWGVVRRSSSRPKYVFRWIALVALLVSFLPDLWLLTDGAATAFPGATLQGVVTLMLMHVAAATVIVWALTGTR